MAGDDERLDRLAAELRALRGQLREATLERHGRLNPFAEDLEDWQAKGRAWTGEDRGVTIYDSATLIGDVELGEGTWVGPFTMLDGSGGLTVGHHCSIATGAQLLTHDTVAWALSGGRTGAEREPTTIGDRCFVGSLSVVVRGVTVGDGCVIGAGAVVTADVAPGMVVAGVPARPVGRAEVGEDGAVSLHRDP